MLRRQWPLIVLLALLGSYVALGAVLVAWPHEEKMYGSPTEHRAPAGGVTSFTLRPADGGWRVVEHDAAGSV